MTDLYKNICHFNGETVIQNITNGWDAVYAIRYDTINADIALRKTWELSDINGQSLVGSTSQIVNFTVISLELITGESEPLLDWKLTASGQYQDGTNDVTIKFSAHIVTKPTFSADSTTPGLHYLKCSSAKPILKSINVIENDVTGAVINIKQLLIPLLDGYQQVLFDGVLASVITIDYAESVNVPWLTPTYFSYALSVMANDEETGLLAILSTSKSKIEEIKALQNSFDGNAFPVDDDINAAVFISPTTLGTESFSELLNKAVGNSMLGSLKPDNQAGLFNEKELQLSYRIDPVTGAATLMTELGAQSAGGRYYPATIPAGKLLFSVGSDTIEITIDELTVDFGGGSVMLITVTTEFNLIVNSDTNEIDIALKGSPKITTNFTQGVASTAEVLAPLLSAGLATLVSELLAYQMDRMGAFLLENKPEKLRQLHLDFQSAVAQAEASGESVSFSIGFGRKMVVSYEDESHVTDKQTIDNAKKLESNFRSRLKFDTELRLKLPEESNFAYHQMPDEPDNTHINNPRQDTNGTIIQDLDDSPLNNTGSRHDSWIVSRDTTTPGLRMFYRMPDGQNVGYIQAMGSNLIRIAGRPRRQINVRRVAGLPHEQRVVQNIELPEINVPRINPDDPAFNVTPNLLTHAQQQENNNALNADTLRIKSMQEQRNNRQVVDGFCNRVKEIFQTINATLTINNESTTTLGRGKFAEFFLGKTPVVKDVMDGTKTISGLNSTESAAFYKVCAEFMNEGYLNGTVSASEYVNAIREFNILSVTGNVDEPVSVNGWKTPVRDADGPPLTVVPGGRDKKLRILTDSWGKPPRRVMSGYLDDLHSTMLSSNQSLPFGSPSATEGLVINAICDAKKPFVATLLGCAFYGLGLAGGYFGGNYMSSLSDQYFFGGAGQKRKDAAEKASENAAAAYVGAADMLFKNVSFPLMTNFISGQTVPVNNSVPSPSNVLIRAAVKGGLVLGVSIVFNLVEEP